MYEPYVLLFPLIGLLLNSLLPFRRPWPGIIASVAVGLSFVFALLDFYTWQTAPGLHGNVAIGTTIWRWTLVDGLNVPFGLWSDPLTVQMLMIITGVGFLIHVYSTGYMADDPGYRRFFAYMNFFILAMCILVSADNLIWLLIGWAGVGLASFLLIGFYYDRESAVLAARKAFVINTIGDVGFMLAIFATFVATGSVRFVDALPKLGTLQHDGQLVNVIALLFLIAAAAKSAQLPLQTWLPDAMEGPTPVSALIHAATMVTAGVYLIARTNQLYANAPTAAMVVAWIGALTALYAAFTALGQMRLKRVLAYSTISQLGYMFLGVGLGAYSASMFHLTTHAFFKALLFLTAGVVVHTFAHNSADVDMRRLGGLNQGPLRWVGWAFVIGALALAGIPPFAGFWSKDEILTAALGEGQVILWILGLLTAFLTALYIFRAYFMTFTGAPREDVQGAHPHPVASSMSIPIVILAILSVIGGLLAFGMGAWLEPVFGDRLREFAFDPITSIAAVVLGLLGIGAAYALRGNYTFGQVGLFRNAFYFDQIYDAIFVRPVRALGSGLTTLVDDWTLNGLASGIYNLVTWLGNGLRLGQTGYTRNYGLAMLIGIFLIAGYFLIVTLGR